MPAVDFDIELRPDFRHLFTVNKVMMRLMPAWARPLQRVAALTRGIAHRSMKPVKARPKNWAQLNHWQKLAWRRKWRDKSRKTPPSPPGEPPRARHGALRNLLAFSIAEYTQERVRFVVGPMKFSRYPTAVVPRLHEYGGLYRVKVTRGFNEEGKPIRESRMVRYPARPYMRPALRRAWEIVSGTPERVHVRLTA